MPIEGASQGAFDQVPNDRNSLGPAVANLTGRSADAVSLVSVCPILHFPISVSLSRWDAQDDSSVFGLSAEKYRHPNIFSLT